MTQPSGSRACARALPHVQRLVVFGSVARGEALPSSDLDLGVLGCSFWEALEISAELGAAAGREPHVVELERASDRLRLEVARDGMLLQEAVPGMFNRFRAESFVRWLDVAPMVALCTEGARRRLKKDAAHG